MICEEDGGNLGSVIGGNFLSHRLQIARHRHHLRTTLAQQQISSQLESLHDSLALATTLQRVLPPSGQHAILQCKAPVVESHVCFLVLNELLGERRLPMDETLCYETRFVKPQTLALQNL